MVLDVEHSKHSVIQFITIHNAAYVSLSDYVVSVKSVASTSLNNYQKHCHCILVLLGAKQLRTVAIVSVQSASTWVVDYLLAHCSIR